MHATNQTATLTRAKQGDDEAFSALVQQHSRRIFQLAFRITRNEHDAEDVVQESFLRAYRQLGGFQSRADFGTWLYRITANCALDLMRSRHQRVKGRTDDITELPIAADRPTPERLAHSTQIQHLVDAALGDLTDLERTAFTLRHHEGRSIDEICLTLGLGQSAAKHAVFRAVKKLRSMLAPVRDAGTMERES